MFSRLPAELYTHTHTHSYLYDLYTEEVFAVLFALRTLVVFTDLLSIPSAGVGR